MAWTAPRSWVADEVVTADVMNTHVRDNLKAIGDAWTSYTPTLSQGASSNIAKTVNYAKYVAAGKLIIVSVKVSATAAGTAGSAIKLTLPVTAAATDFLGQGMYFDSGTATYGAVAFVDTTTTVTLYRSDAIPTNYIGADPNIAVASGDVYRFHLTYESA